MCNACHFACCATDCVDGCGCDDCLHWECWGDDDAAEEADDADACV